MAPDVCIGFVHPGMVHEQFMHSMLTAFSDDGNEHLSSVIRAECTGLLADARCDIVKEFLDGHEEPWLWCLDTDIVFSPDTHRRLLEVADPVDRPIVSAAYYARWADRDELAPVWAVWRDDELKPVIAIPDDLQVVRLAAVGFGCILIHRRVLEQMRASSKDPWPWFGHDAIDTPKGIRRLGEDFTFCVRALRAGFLIHGLNHTVGHRKYVVFDDSTVREAAVA